MVEGRHLGLEFHRRQDDFARLPMQTLLRPFYQLNLSADVDFAAVYSYVETYPYSTSPLIGNGYEDNIWIQTQLHHSIG